MECLTGVNDVETSGQACRAAGDDEIRPFQILRGRCVWDKQLTDFADVCTCLLAV